MSAVNNIPEGWVETTLGNLSTPKGGKRLPLGESLVAYKTEHPYIRITDFKGNTINKQQLQFVENEVFKSISRYIVNTNDVIISIVGTIGLIAKIDKELNNASLTENCVKLVNLQNIDASYLYYFLTSNLGQNEINKNTVGAVQKKLPIYGVQNLIIRHPLPPEQKSIAAILTSFDDKIELLQAQNKTLEETAQTIFKEWFGKYQIGDELPEGWKVGKIEEFIGELGTGTRPKGGVGGISEGIPSVGAESIGGITNFDYSKTKYVPVEFFNKMTRGIVKDYDILIYKDGGLPGTFIPKFSMFGEGFPFSTFCINEHVFRLQPKEVFQRFYLYNWLNSRYCKKQLQNIGGKAAIPGINSTDLKNLEIIIPDENLIKSYDCCVKPFYKKILTNMVQIQSLTQTRDALLPKLMSGELRVKM